MDYFRPEKYDVQLQQESIRQKQISYQNMYKAYSGEIIGAVLGMDDKNP